MGCATYDVVQKIRPLRNVSESKRCNIFHKVVRSVARKLYHTFTGTVESHGERIPKIGPQLAKLWARAKQ